MSSPDPGKSARGALPPSEAVSLAGLVDYAPGAVVSRAIVQSKTATLTLFAFDDGQGLSEHRTPFDAHVLILDGEAVLTIGGTPVIARAGDVVRMPAEVPHALDARGRFKMLLVMVRG